jgi:hypothetical protein
MHVSERDEVASATQQQKQQNLDAVVLLWLFVCCYFRSGRAYI